MSVFDAFARLEALDRSRRENKASPPSMIIAGLGNPGKKYERTRHNTGFICIDELAGELGAPIIKSRFDALSSEAVIGGEKALLLKPQTFMNLSGTSVGKAAVFYKIPPEKVFMIFDDISLPAGKARFRKKGSAGGHNGIKSIIDALGSEDFPRLKIGVGNKPRPEYDLADWVLSSFTEDELASIKGAGKLVLPAAEKLIKGDADGVMELVAKYNAGLNDGLKGGRE